MLMKKNSYAEFQARIMARGDADLILQDAEGRIISFQIENTQLTAFPRQLFLNCKFVALIDPFRGSAKPLLPQGTALYGKYDAAGPFISVINYIYEKTTGFKLSYEKGK